MMALDMVAAVERGNELEAGVLERCREGDPLAFRAFVVRFERPVFAVLSRILGRGPHVEDLAQETFLKAYRALPRFEPEGEAKLSTWLLTIATRTAIDAVRKRKVKERLFAESLVEETHEDTPERQAQLSRLRRGILDALGDLPVDQRAAFVLFEMHGLTLPEIGEALGVPAATAKTRVFRARKKLEEALGHVKEAM